MAKIPKGTKPDWVGVGRFEFQGQPITIQFTAWKSPKNEDTVVEAVESHE